MLWKDGKKEKISVTEKPSFEYRKEILRETQVDGKTRVAHCNKKHCTFFASAFRLIL